jgi:hypothetical protein
VITYFGTTYVLSVAKSETHWIAKSDDNSIRLELIPTFLHRDTNDCFLLHGSLNVGEKSHRLFFKFHLHKHEHLITRCIDFHSHNLDTNPTTYRSNNPGNFAIDYAIQHISRLNREKDNLVNDIIDLNQRLTKLERFIKVPTDPTVYPGYDNLIWDVKPD